MADFNDILPAGVDIRAIELTSNQPTVQTRSLSGRQQVRTFSGQFWSAKIEMPQLKESQLRTVYAFLMKQKGGFGTFTIAPTNLTRVNGTQNSATEGISSGGAIGATSITTSGSNEFAAGDMIKFSGPSGHTKAYMVTGVSGQTLTFEPGLTHTVTSSHTVDSKASFEMLVRLEGDKITYRLEETGFGFLEFDVVEAV